MKVDRLDKRSKNIRKNILKMLSSGRRGHLGSALSLVEILRVLFDSILRFDPNNSKWEKRDRLILSKGHGCLALYAMLADKGFFAEKHLNSFCQKDSMLGGHPQNHIPGIEAATGSLGHGLPIGVGMAVALRNVTSDKLHVTGKKNVVTSTSHFSPVTYHYPKVFVILGDGEMDEGSVWEAAMSASKHRLDNLAVIVDYNKYQSYGKTREVLDLEPIADKWKAFGFAVKEVNGHDVKALEKTLKNLPFSLNMPSVVIAHTVKGKGIDIVENNANWHHRRGITDEEIKSFYKMLEDY